MDSFLSVFYYMIHKNRIEITSIRDSIQTSNLSIFICNLPDPQPDDSNMFPFQWLSSLKNQLRAHSSRTRRNSNRRNQGPFARALISRNAIEALEDRTLLTAFTVLNMDDSGEGSLRAAIEQANATAGADTISFDAALAGQTIVLTNELLISDDLTITGLGADQLTLDGNGDSRIFNIDDGSLATTITVEIVDLMLTNGSAENGGAINNLETLSIVDSTLSGNTALQNGGGIYNYRGNLSIENSRFSENRTGTEESQGYGAGIYLYWGSLTVSASDFTENEAMGLGGGIYITRADQASVSNSTFESNFANSGGAIYSLYESLTVDETSFSGNQATEEYGGAIYFNGVSAQISNSQFTENYSEANGGALFAFNGNVTVTASVFTENIAKSLGGGIQIIVADVTVNDTTLIGNQAGSGGAINILGQGSLALFSSTLTENTALGGGAINNNGAKTIFIYNSTLSYNLAHHSGGALYSFVNSAVSVVNSTIVGNEATHFPGGGIYRHPGSGTFILQNSIVAGNRFNQFSGSYTGSNNIIQASIEGLLDPVLRENGGSTKTHALLSGSAAINAGSDSTAIAAGLTQDQRGEGYHRIYQGFVDIGAYEFYSGDLVVDTNSDVDDGNYSVGNLSLREAIKLANETPQADTITFDASLFDQTLMLYNELVITDDVTIIGHGAEHLTLSGDGTRRLFRIDDGEEETSINVELSDFTLTNGFANYSSGGAIHSLETLSISDVLFTDNQASVLGGLLSASRYGGAIYSGGDLTVTNSTFVRNSADWYGGAIYSTEGLLSITGCDFTENQTSQAGGAIVVQDGDLTVAASTFTENSSDNLGGAIYITEGVLTVSESVFTENRSGVGGAIYHQISVWFPPVFTELSISDSTFQGNTATSSGGAVYYASALWFYSAYHNAYIENSLFSENSASSGGALSTNGNNVLVSGSTFVKNRARFYGGGIDDSSRNLTVQNSLFEKNSSSSSGGGLNVDWKLILINSTLSGNTSLLAGGGIAFGNSSPTFEIINSTLTGNAAVKVGGGIYSFWVNSGSITNSIIAGNSAPSIPQVLTQYTRNNSIVQDSIEGLLDPILRDNGGLTKTHALLPGSAAIDAGNDTALENVNLSILNRRETTHDSRGAGFDRYRGDAIDIGAFEVQSPFTQIEMTLVDSKTATAGNGEIATLPDSLNRVDEWSGYWLEIWVSAPSATDAGVMSVALNLTYNTAITTATAIEFGAAFTINQAGTIDDSLGLIAGLSAETNLPDAGDDQRVLFARIRFESTADDGIDLDLAGQTLIAESPEFSIFSSEIQLTGGAESEEVHGPSPETLVFANPYDLNDDGAINFRDLVLFASVYNTDPREAASDYSWFADLDQSNNVNFRDLISFASNYGKRKSNPSPIHYPQNFTENLSRHLSVEPTMLPQENPWSLEQPDAEAVFEGVKEYLEPQLTSEQNEKLAQVDIQVIDLANGVLSNTVRNTIYVDVNAASYGWFIDNTPTESSEFYESGTHALRPVPWGSDEWKVDLWTVILHEIGHVLGYDHEESGLMHESLAPGVRYLPDWEVELDLFFSGLTDESNLNEF